MKVNFHGASAQRIAESKIGTGDIVFLGLNGSRFRNQDDRSITSTGYIDWDLVFENSVLIEVTRCIAPSWNNDFC